MTNEALIDYEKVSDREGKIKPMTEWKIKLDKLGYVYLPLQTESELTDIFENLGEVINETDVIADKGLSHKNNFCPINPLTPLEWRTDRTKNIFTEIIVTKNAIYRFWFSFLRELEG